MVVLQTIVFIAWDSQWWKPRNSALLCGYIGKHCHNSRQSYAGKIETNLNFWTVKIKEERFFESLRLIRVCVERNSKHQCHKYKAALYCQVISNVFTIALKMATWCYVSSGTSYWQPAFRWRPFPWVQTLATKPWAPTQKVNEMHLSLW